MFQPSHFCIGQYQNKHCFCNGLLEHHAEKFEVCMYKLFLKRRRNKGTKHPSASNSFEGSSKT